MDEATATPKLTLVDSVQQAQQEPELTPEEAARRNTAAQAFDAAMDAKAKQHEAVRKMKFLACMQGIIALNGSTAELDKFNAGEDVDALVRKYGKRASGLFGAISTFAKADQMEAVAFASDAIRERRNCETCAYGGLPSRSEYCGSGCVPPDWKNWKVKVQA